MMGAIYGLKIATSRVLYVGQTTIPIKYRWSSHRSAARYGSPDLVHAWMRSVGPDNVVWVCLEEEVIESDMADRERHWILTLNTLVTVGGLNQRLVTELVGPARERHAKRMREVHESPYVRAKISESMRARYEDPAARAAVSAGNRRRYERPEERAKSRATMAETNHVRWHVLRGIVNPDCRLC